ncbi:DDE-type integrase/transposase/recombinase, partial [Mycobacterium intracellulare]|nr:DDE-type integrase/transposase/recombinase [Mycobacterium intracellulare]
MNHKRVARVMRSTGIAGYRRRRRVKTTVADPANQKVPDLLGRDFTAAAPNTTYVGDITYLPLATGGNLYLATVIDCCSRRVAGWAIADHMRTELVTDALIAADRLRGGLARSVFHSDYGSQSVHLNRFRGPMPRSGGYPVDGGGRDECRQRAGR